MQRKTYIKENLLEWHGELHFGVVRMHVDFTGGCSTENGFRHAHYITTNANTQRFIENSAEFLSGSVKLTRVEELPDPIGKTRVTSNTSETRETSTSSTSSETRESADGEGDGLKAVDAPDRDWAAGYLIDTFPEKGYTKRGLCNWDLVNAAAAECGVRFIKK